ncbi:FAD-dependent oxidoreductase [Bacillus cereus]
MKKNNKCERNCSHFFGKKRKGDKYVTTQVVNVIGAGLAGSEAAYQIAKRGVQVKLYEMRPVRQTPAHHTDKFAELVCSNSLRANTLTNAVGVIKEEMRLMDSVIIRAADECSVPAGGALAVDRHEFAAKVTEYVKTIRT